MLLSLPLLRPDERFCFMGVDLARVRRPGCRCRGDGRHTAGLICASPAPLHS